MGVTTSFLVSEFTTRRVRSCSGFREFLDGKRVRKNLKIRVEAMTNVQAHESKRLQAEVAIRATLTRLTDEELHEVEAVFQRLKDQPKSLSFCVDHTLQTTVSRLRANPFPRLPACIPSPGIYLIPIR